MFPGSESGVAVSAIQSSLWGWLALTYHLAFFTAISPPASAFAVLSLVGACVFFWLCVVRGKLEFGLLPGSRAVVSIFLMVFALAVYTAWTCLTGHRHPTSATFGLPCPTAIFTLVLLGLLAFVKAPYSRHQFVIPVLWSFVGGQADLLPDIPADYGLVVAGLVGIVLLLQPNSFSARSGKAA